MKVYDHHAFIIYIELFGVIFDYEIYDNRRNTGFSWIDAI